MAGHNKWTQIKRKKGVADAVKSRRFSLLAKQIQLAAKHSGADKNSPDLKAAIERARAANLPNENIERALRRATDTTALAEVMFEAYGPGGAAIIIEGLTDNKNRTAQEIKHLLTEHGATLAAPGAALWAFEKIGGQWRARASRALTAEASRALNELVEALAGHDETQTVVTDAAPGISPT